MAIVRIACYRIDMTTFPAIDEAVTVPGLGLRYPAELTRDGFGDLLLSSGYYGLQQPGAWSVETGFSPRGKDHPYWERVIANAAAIDRWMAEQQPLRAMRLKVDFVGCELHIRNFDWPDGPPLGVIPAT
jgi:hypothetical protein